jgi:hypothetical protein
VLIRESRLGKAIVAGIAVWSLWFAFDVARIGARVTSKQWQYLMEVPAGRWFWAVAFGIGAAITLLGLVYERYIVSAIGLFFIGSSCSLIAAFYLLAPLIDEGLLTLGYNPWFFPAAFAYIFAALIGRPTLWS